MKELAGALTLRRDAAFGKASAAVESRRYRSLLFDTLQWLETGDWAKHARYYKQRPIERFAADIFARRTKTITKKAKKIRELDSQQRHKLRIAVKKLRYHRAAPAFGPQPDRRAVTSPVFRRRIKAL
jgi:CHAD domain-containing protein